MELSCTGTARRALPVTLPSVIYRKTFCETVVIEIFAKFIHGLRLKTKITLGVTVMLIFCGLGIGIILSNMASTALLEEGRKRGGALTAGLAYRMAEPILAMDFLQMKNLIDNVHNQYDDVVYVFLTDASDNVLSHTFSGGFPIDLLRVGHRGPVIDLNGQTAQPVLLSTESGLIYDFNTSVVLGDRNLGTVRLGLSRQEMDAQVLRLRVTSLISTIGVVGLGIILALWFAHTVTFRLNRLKESAEAMVKGDLDVVYKRNAGDEVQDLAEAFDAMAVTVKTHIEELTQREKTIARQQGLLKTIMNVTPDFITLQNKDLVYQFASKAFCDHFNLKEEDVIGKTDFDIFSEHQADQNFHEDKQILITGKPLSKEIAIELPEGQKSLHVVKIPVYDPEGGIIGLLLTARDISILKKYQEQLIQSQKMEDLGRLAGGVAHEINTPLGIILGYTQLLMEEIKEKHLLDDLKIIEKQTRISRKIVADLLSFSRYSRSAAESIDINQSLQEVVELVEHMFSMNHIKVSIDIDENIPPLTGDKERLKQVWLNMLNNAADAIGEEGVIYITSKLCAHRKRVLVSITDTGKGIKEKDLKKIFDPFFTTKEVGKGTGLGLSVSFGIIEEHGGSISALSPPPKGYLATDFNLNL
jgi:two-component system, NtrC family, sensor kinase